MRADGAEPQEQAPAVEEAFPGLGALSDEPHLLATVFTHLPFNLIGAVSLVCRTWAEVAADPHWKPDVVLFAWGHHTCTGLDDDCGRPTLLEFSLRQPIQQIACSHAATLALTVGGEVFHWGTDCRMEVGWTPEPRRVEPLRDIASVACSVPGYHHGRSSQVEAYHCAAVGRDGSLFTWGYAARGQLCVEPKCSDGELLSQEDADFVGLQVREYGCVGWVHHPMRVRRFGPPTERTAAHVLSRGRAVERVRHACCGLTWTALCIEREEVVAEAEGDEESDEARAEGGNAACSALLTEIALVERAAPGADSGGGGGHSGDGGDERSGPKPGGVDVGASLHYHGGAAAPLMLVKSNRPSALRAALEKLPPGSQVLAPDGRAVQLRAGVLIARVTAVEVCGHFCRERPHMLAEEPELRGVPLRALVAGGFHCCALTCAGQLYTFGDTVGRDLSNGNLLGLGAEPILLGCPPRRVGFLGEVREVSASTYMSVAISEGGGVFTWGDSDGGALGHSQRECDVPTMVSALAGLDAAYAAASYTNGGIVTAEGRAFMWGGTDWEYGITRDSAVGAHDGPRELRWGGVPACYKCSSMALAHRHGYLLFRKQRVHTSSSSPAP